MKYLFPVAALSAIFLFVSTFIESDPQTFFGYAPNVWITRMLWLIAAICFIIMSLRIRKAEKQAKDV